MELEEKIRTLAAADATMQSFFAGSNGTFRWFNRQLPQGYIEQGACLRMLRVSELLTYLQQGLLKTTQPLFQFDVFSLDSNQARAAIVAVINWLGTVDFHSGAQFGSPVTTPPQFPNFVVNRRSGMFYQIEPHPYAETIDVRIFNLEP